MMASLAVLLLGADALAERVRAARAGAISGGALSGGPRDEEPARVAARSLLHS